MKTFISLLVLLSTLVPVLAQAQAMTVFGTGSDAQRCGMEAGLPNLPGMAVRDALESCNRALEHDVLNRKDRAATYINRGILHTTAARYQDALHDFDLALELVDDLGEAHVGRGNLLFMAGRFDLAVEEYEKALAMQLGQMHLALFNLALAQERLGLLEEAREAYTKALELHPGWALPREKLDQLAVESRGVDE
jgi:tetratricopeptide (TPR) repeat protein